LGSPGGSGRELELLLQTLVTGLAIGGIYALMAVGYSLVFSVLNFSNFAHGTVIMLASYVGYYLLTSFHQPMAVAILGAVVGAAGLAVLNESLAYSPLRARRAPSLYFMISAMGTSIFLENMVYVTIGSHFYAYPEVFRHQTISVLGSSLGVLDLFALGFSAAAITVLHYFLTRSKLGTAIRAASYDMTVASINGVNINRLVKLVFVLAGSLAGLSGIFMGFKYIVYPTMGWITNKAYIAAVIGGLGSLPGAVIGGLVLGLTETLVSVYVSSIIRDVFSFSLLVVLLLVLPTGLLGKSLEEKV